MAAEQIEYPTSSFPIDESDADCIEMMRRLSLLSPSTDVGVKKYILDENSPTCSGELKIKYDVIEPFITQLTSLYQMIECEKEKIAHSIPPKQFNLADKPSAGKTLLTLMLAGIEPEESQISKTFLFNPSQEFFNYDRHICNQRTKIKTVKTTLIGVSKNVLTAWKNTVINYTNLSYFIIENSYNLNVLQKLVRKNKIKNIDVIIFKYSDMQNAELAEEMDIPATKYPVHKWISMITGDIKFRRYVVDDYDLLMNIKANSTVRDLHISQQIIAEYYWSVSSTLDDERVVCRQVKCKDEYIDEKLQLTKINFRILSKEHTQAQALKIIDIFGAPELKEALRADAINMASSLMGINAYSVGDFVKKLLSDNLSKIKWHRKEIVRLEGKMSKIEQMDNEKFIKKYGDINVKQIKLNELCQLRAQQFEFLAPLELEMNRFKENIQAKECMCCTLEVEPEESQYVIAKCCQIFLCEDCVFKPDTKGCRIINRCPRCLVPIEYASDIIKINGGTVEAMTHDPKLITEAIIEEAEEAKDEVKIVDDKREIIRCLLTNTPFTAVTDTVSDPFVKGLITGVQSIPKTDKDPNKFLIYSRHEETTIALRQYLSHHSIKSKIYGGTRHQRDAIIEEFKTTLDVLIMSDVENAAGIHLPFVSHVIFYHNVYDESIKRQLAGRAQRVGRKHDLSIIMLQYGESETY